MVTVLGLSLAVARGEGQTNDMSQTTRWFNGLRVDVKPLADWYHAKQASNPAADDESRPLKAWHLVRIQRIIQSNFTWTVQADVDGEQETLVLKNPPQRELNEYNRLKAAHGQLVARTNQLQQELRRVEAARRQAAYEEGGLLRMRYYWRQVAMMESRLEMLAYNETRLEQALATAQAQLRQVEARGWNFNKPFTMDCLALKTGQTIQNLPVYDRGQVL